ncbi:acyltransferase [Terrabacter carboxydivorans]|uniref:Acyltransferase n=1 Tax=Terrabacter carboxydivorans TaxID=619730 RepID=A0ABN3LVX1_9MICO
MRFAAALLVVVFHLSAVAPGLGDVGRLAAAGYVGVTFFFVLSGFVLTYSWDIDATAARFYRRRFARIYPMHLLFVALAMLPWTGAPNWGALPANLTLVQAWSPDDAVVRSFSGVSWSLSCEFFFYAAFPFLVRLLWLRVRRPLVVGGVSIGLAYVVGVAVQRHDPEWGAWLFHLPAFRMVEFVAGSLAAMALTRGWVPRLRVRWAAVFVVVSYLGVLLLPVAIGYRFEDRWALSLAMVPSLVMLIAANARVDLVGAPSPLQGRTLVSLGQWSFCVYMAHPLVMGLTQPLLASRGVYGSLLGCALVILAVVGVSFALHVLVERPFERRLRGSGDSRLSGSAIEDAPEESLSLAPGRSAIASS